MTWDPDALAAERRAARRLRRRGSSSILPLAAVGALLSAGTVVWLGGSDRRGEPGEPAATSPPARIAGRVPGPAPAPSPSPGRVTEPARPAPAASAGAPAPSRRPAPAVEMPLPDPAPPAVVAATAPPPPSVEPSGAAVAARPVQDAITGSLAAPPLQPAPAPAPNVPAPRATPPPVPPPLAPPLSAPAAPAPVPDGKLVSLEPPSPRPRTGATEAEAERLTLRAVALIKQGDISAARLFLDRAAAGDHGPAVFALAETYDPTMLDAWRVRGIRPDVERARSLYERALASGIVDARDRLERLR